MVDLEDLVEELAKWDPKKRYEFLMDLLAKLNTKAKEHYPLYLGVYDEYDRCARFIAPSQREWTDDASLSEFGGCFYCNIFLISWAKFTYCPCCGRETELT
jgi:hypothetical protein